jgi:HSP20 family protein
MTKGSLRRALFIFARPVHERLPTRGAKTDVGGNFLTAVNLPGSSGGILPIASTNVFVDAPNQEDLAMTLPSRWNPIRQLTRFEPLSDFDELFRGLSTRPMMRELEKTMDMRLDVVEDDKLYQVKIDMPGVKKGDIDVSVEGNLVTISAEIKREKSEEHQRELYTERYSGKAYRSFTLPLEVDSTRSEAKYDGGVLMLTLPKKSGSVSKHLPVH